MRVVAVHTAAREQTIQMQGRIFFLAVIDSEEQPRILKEIPVLNLLCNARQFLVDNAPCAHI